MIPGFFVGFICVLLGGCPIRQTVMASEGSYKAGFFFIGMCVGSIIFAAFVSGWVVALMRLLGFGAGWTMTATFLFCELLSPERVRWLGAVLGDRDEGAATVFLTGDALFSLVDARTRDTWKMIAGLPHLRIIADGDELQLQGLKDSVAKGSPGITIAEDPGQDSFWPMLTRTLHTQRTGRE